MIQVQGSRIVVATRMVQAEFDNGLLVSLKASDSARNLLSGDRPAGLAPLQLVFSNGAGVDLGADARSTIVTRKLNDNMAEVRFHGWSADGVLRISECPETGDLLLEPSAYSNRAGLAACRYNVAGIA